MNVIGMASPVSADWSSTATLSATDPSTGTTSPWRISSRSPGSKWSSATSSSWPSRWRKAVRGTRASSAVISRRAVRSAKASRNWPPAYINATMAAARFSPTASAAVIDSAATMSSPTSPRRRLVTISTRSASRIGTVTPAQIAPDQASRPASLAAKPVSSPAATRPARTGRTYLSALAVVMAALFTLRAGLTMSKIKCLTARYGLDPAAEFRLIAANFWSNAMATANRRIVWLNVVTVVSAAILIGAEVFGADQDGGADDGDDVEPDDAAVGGGHGVAPEVGRNQPEFGRRIKSIASC